MKINIGGETKKEGWKNFNAQQKPDVDIIGNIKDLSQFENESIDEIYASHVLEHVDIRSTPSTIKGIYRVLKKGGKFYVSVPDMDALTVEDLNDTEVRQPKSNANNMETFSSNETQATQEASVFETIVDSDDDDQNMNGGDNIPVIFRLKSG